MGSKRIKYIDYAKGFAILCVLLGHMEIHPILKNYIYSFHMPLFFILSGYFMKRTKLDKEIVINNFKSIMVPYFIIGGGMCIWQLYSDFDAFTTLETSTLASLFFLGYRVKGEYIVYFVGAIWFLWVLFFSKLYTQYLLTRKYGSFIIFLVAICSMVFSRTTHIVPPFGLLQSLTVSVFLYIGLLFNEKDIFNINISKWLYFILLIAALLIMPKASVALRQNSLPFNIISCLVSSFISFVIIKGLKIFDDYLCFVTDYIKKILLFCGQNSLAFLCVHTIEIRYHWLTLDSKLIIIEFLLRTCYILLIIKALSYIPLTKRLFKIQ